MSAPDPIAREFETFARRLLGMTASPALLDAYRRAHQLRSSEFVPRDRFDGHLLAVARRGGVFLALADAHARRFRRAAVLRKKLCLVLALLECDPESSARLDSVGRGGALGFWFFAVVRGGIAVLSAIVATFWFLPAMILFSNRPTNGKDS